MKTIQPTIPRIETWKQRRIRRKALKRQMMTPEEREASIKKSKDDYFSFLDNRKKEDAISIKNYKTNIKFLEVESKNYMCDSWNKTITLILDEHNNPFIRNTYKVRNHVRRCVYRYKEYRADLDNKINSII